MPRIYLDYNATVPLRPEAKEAMAEVWEAIGNPSSVHWHGRHMRHFMEDARQIIADRFHISTKRLVFTSGATEGNNFVIGYFPGQVFVSATEHASVHMCRGNLIEVPVNEDGLPNLGVLEDQMRNVTEPFLVSISIANNETGVIVPFLEVKELVKKYKGFIHVDAAQGFGKGKLPFSLQEIAEADYVTLSAHKFGGPLGVGALIINPDISLPPMIIGGGQERSFRGGTQNVPGIAGMARAFIGILQEDLTSLGKWKNEFETTLKEKYLNLKIVSVDTPRLDNTTCLLFPNIKGEFLVMRCDLEGVSLSSGSACSSGKIKSSRVLKAMGYGGEQAANSLRISSGWQTKKQDYDCLLNVLENILGDTQQERKKYA